MYIICISNVCYMYIICVLYVDYMYIICISYVYHMYTICILYYMYIIHTMYIYYIYKICMLLCQFTCIDLCTHIYIYTYNAHVCNPYICMIVLVSSEITQRGTVSSIRSPRNKDVRIACPLTQKVGQTRGKISRAYLTMV